MLLIVHESEMWALEAVNLLSKKNLDYLLEMFEEDATVFEPFSRKGMLNGIAEIAPFLKVVCNNPSFLIGKETTRITALKYESYKVKVTSKNPGNCKLNFEFGNQEANIEGKKLRKIKKLRIDV